MNAISTLPEPSTAQERLRAAKRKAKELRLERKARELEDSNDMMESLAVTGGPNGDWVGSFYQMLDRWNQAQAYFLGATNPNDRKYGRNWPIFLNEVDLRVARMPSRILTSTNNYAIGILEGWLSYMVGEGYIKHVQPKHGKDALVPKPILAKLQAVIDDFADRNDWDGGERPGLEEEFIRRPEVDGASILCLHEDDAGLTWASTIEPEQVTQPPGSDMDYFFGIYCPKDNPQKPEKFYITPLYGDAVEGSEYDAEQIVYYKTNVMRQMKVGFPSFTFSTLNTLDLADQLRQSMGVGGKIQASIALIRQHDNASKENVQSFTETIADFQRRSLTGATENVRQYTPGGIEDIPKGLQYAEPPSTQATPGHIQILHACLRAAAVRYNMPDWLSSGDASSNTYSNSVATGSTFGRRIIREQKRPAHVFKRVFWWALSSRCERAGVITATGEDGQVYSMPWEQLKNLVEIVVTPASPEERDKKEEADRLAELVRETLMSPQQAIVELGHDVEETKSQIKAWREDMAPPPALPGVPGVPGDPAQPSEKRPGETPSAAPSLPMRESAPQPIVVQLAMPEPSAPKVEEPAWIELPDDLLESIMPEEIRGEMSAELLEQQEARERAEEERERLLREEREEMARRRTEDIERAEQQRAEEERRQKDADAKLNALTEAQEQTRQAVQQSQEASTALAAILESNRKTLEMIAVSQASTAAALAELAKAVGQQKEIIVNLPERKPVAFEAIKGQDGRMRIQPIEE